MTNRQGIYGMHDPGDWFNLIAQAGATAWCTYTVAVGCDPADHSGQNFGVPGLITPIARLNNGYAPVGTIPLPHRYHDFAERCANFVAASKGCKHWIIGNEIAMRWEWPEGRQIGLDEYVQCFHRCREAIRLVQPEAIVIPQAPAPWNAELCYPGNERGDWCQQLRDMLTLIGAGRVDGIALHTYTHAHTPALVTDATTMAAPFSDRHYQFIAYRDFMQAIPTAFRTLPVFITESNPEVWQDSNNGWLQAAYAEIDQWNQAGRQPIHCLCLYRWQTEDREQYHISTRAGVIEDFRQALTRHYVVPQRTQGELPLLYTAYVVAAAGLNLRSDPLTQSTLIATLPFGSVLLIFKEYAGWLYCQAGELWGWVYSGFVSKEPPRQQSDLGESVRRIAAQYAVDPRLAQAVFAVESAGKGFIDGKLLVRFEPKVWLSSLPADLRPVGGMLFTVGETPADDRASLSGAWTRFHGNNDLEHLVIRLASAVEEASALQSASYGLAQIMGFNAMLVGYANVKAMIDAFTRNEDAQIEAFFIYCSKKRSATGSALDALKSGDYRTFARLYNGVGQEDMYAARIQRALNYMPAD